MRELNDFGRFIHDKRKEAHLTQDALAEKLGVSPQAVSKWENGVGYPDITLCADIADALGVSIDELFRDVDKEKKADTEFPENYKDMPRVFSDDKYACYSSKVVAAIEKAKKLIRFADKSIADLENGTVTNEGEGDVVIFDKDGASVESHETQTLNEELKFFGNISVVTGGDCDVEIAHHPNGMAGIRAEGSTAFINALHRNLVDNTLYVRVNEAEGMSLGHKNKLWIDAPIEDGGWISVEQKGKGECNIDVDFNDMTLSTFGNGDIIANKTHRLTAKSYGNGNIDLECADEVALIEIKGNGDVTITRAANVDVDIMGNGDVTVDEASGTLSVDVLGSGDVDVSGTVDKLICEIQGNGDLVCGELTAGYAEISLSGNSDAYVGRIIGTSKEDIGPNCTLTVFKRG